MIINGGFGCLWDLIFPVDPIDFLSAFKQGAGLLKMKADIVFYTLRHRFQDPGIIANSGIGARFPSADDLFDAGAVRL